jgi:hypothetical protein
MIHCSSLVVELSSGDRRVRHSDDGGLHVDGEHCRWEASKRGSVLSLSGALDGGGAGGVHVGGGDASWGEGVAVSVSLGHVAAECAELGFL